MNTAIISINEAAATLNGVHTMIKVGNWSKPRKFFACGILMYLEVSLDCIDCCACQERFSTIYHRMKNSDVPYFWVGERWLVLVNNAEWSTSVNVAEGGDWKCESKVLEFLSKTIEEECVLME